MRTGKDKLKIVYAGRFNESENLSGPEKTAKRIFTEHQKDNFAYFIQYFFDGHKYSVWKKLFGKESKNSVNGIIYTLGLFRIFGVLNKIKPDVIHLITFERFAAVFILYKTFHKIKIVYNEHGIITFTNYYLKETPPVLKLKDKFCEKLFLKHSDKIIFLSENSIDIAEEVFDIDETKAVILPNGIDVIFNFKSSGSHTDKLKAVLLFKNELHKSGLEFLMKFTRVFNGNLEIYILTNSKMQLTDKNGLSINLIRLMKTDELAEFYKDKDIFLSLNKYDTFSITTAEAMSSGLIPVITKQTGISRYVEDGYNGFTVEYGCLPGLKDIIMKIMSLPYEEKKNISQNAMKISESLSWSSVYEMYCNLYKELTG